MAIKPPPDDETCHARSLTLPSPRGRGDDGSLRKFHVKIHPSRFKAGLSIIAPPPLQPLALRDALTLARARIDATDARVLLRHVLNAGDDYLAAHPEHLLSAGQRAAYDALVERRAQGEPVAYLVGEKEFYGLAFKITPAVLIPRPETELLVDLALERIPENTPRRILDLGTGSGIVAVTLAKLRPPAHITALDRSKTAIEVAQENAHRILGSENRIRFLTSDWFAAVAGERFDLIVANPPYVAEGDAHLRRGDLRFEPRQALAAGGDGLQCIRHIVEKAPAHLCPGGSLLFEHGYDQAAACRELLARHGYRKIVSARDLAGIERVSGGRAPTGL